VLSLSLSLVFGDLVRTFGYPPTTGSGQNSLTSNVYRCIGVQVCSTGYKLTIRRGEFDSKSLRCVCVVGACELASCSFVCLLVDVQSTPFYSLPFLPFYSFKGWRRGGGVREGYNMKCIGVLHTGLIIMLYVMNMHLLFWLL
jgi:hypothetical protein